MPTESCDLRPPIAPADRPGRGILLMLATMALFSSSDGLAKLLAEAHHPIQIGWARFMFGGALVLLPLLLRAGPRRVLATARPGLQVVRGVCMLGSAQFFIFGLAVLPIAEATAIGFASPLIVTALSIPLLGETVGLRRWLAVVVGFAGVLIVVRPGSGVFSAGAAYPLLSALCWALGLIVTRRMRHEAGPLTTLAWTVLTGLAGTTALVGFVWTWPSAAGWLLMAAMGALHGLAHYALIRALGHGPASLLAPFVYSQMVWAALLGLAVFGTFPDGWAWLGTAIIVGSGLYTLHRERVREAARKERAADPAAPP